ESAGVKVREHAEVARIERDAAGVAGVTLAGGEQVSATRVVLAAGPWSDRIEGLPAEARVPVRPVKGQILRLRDPGGPGLLEMVVRFEGGYVVPRAEGRYVLGATVEERGFAPRATVGGVYELLRDAGELLPGLRELEIEELSVGFRPGTPDNAPAIGPGAVDGLIWATGHHRNGILLAPLTAEMVVAAIEGAGTTELEHRSIAELLATCGPRRLAPGAREAVAQGGAPVRSLL